MSLAARLRDATPCRPRHPAFFGIDPGRLAGMWLHPWLRTHLLLRLLIETSWDAETAALVKSRGVIVAQEIRALMRSPWFS